MKPYCVEAWTTYAKFLIETNDLVFADFIYYRILSLQPESYERRNEYGKLLLKLNKIKEAKNQFKIANNYAKESCPNTLNNLADVYYLSDKFEKSILKYKQLLEIDPDRTYAYFQLGIAYIKVTDYQNGSNAFKKAVSLEPENVLFLRRLAITYCYLDNMELSVETYKQCLNLKPQDFNLNLELALVYLNNIKNYHEAIIYLQKCIQLNPDRIDLYKNLMIAYRKTKDHLKASDACMVMGNLHLEKDDYENARTSFCCAVLFNPRNAFGHWKMGLTMYKLGHLNSALKR